MKGGDDDFWGWMLLGYPAPEEVKGLYTALMPSEKDGPERFANFNPNLLGFVHGTTDFQWFYIQPLSVVSFGSMVSLPLEVSECLKDVYPLETGPHFTLAASQTAC